MVFNIPSKAMRRMYMARERVARRNPFFATILFGARLLESEKMETIWTDSRDIYFNPAFVTDQANDEYMEGLLLHTVLHCAMLHVSRMKYRDAEMWDQACDFPVNEFVKQYFKLHPSALLDNKYGLMSPEAVYELLEKQQKKPQQPQPGGDGKSGKDKKKQEAPGGMTPPESEKEEQQAEREWKRTVSNAIDTANKAGTMPGFLERLISDITPSEKLDWRDLIRDMSRDAKSNRTRTWTRPNRRRLGNDEYMPGYGNDNVYRLILCMDVSGSVDGAMIKQMCGEAASLLDQDLISHVTLLSVDTKIQRRLEAHSSEDIVGWKPGGGGGTDFLTAMDEVAMIPDAIGCVFLTDMQTSSFGKEPPFPIVWVNWINDNSKAPFGRTVHYT